MEEANMTPNTNKPDEKTDDTIIHDLLIKHIEDWNGLKMASIQAYLQSGKVSGSLFTAIKDMLNEYATLKLHAKAEECERLHKRVAELEHIIDHEINDDEDNFQHCADCDLPDACSDYGCAIENGIKRKNDGVF